jgi:peptide/nickel transport system permease protein
VARDDQQPVLRFLNSPRQPLFSFKRVARTFLRHARVNILGTFCGFIILFLVFIALAAPLVSPYDPKERNLDLRYDPPSTAHPFGTDRTGRDQLSQIIYGSRISLQVGFASVASGVTIALTIAVLTGYLGGWIDTICQRVVDTMIAFPGLIVALFLIAILEPGVSTVILTLAIVFIAPASRPIRAQVISIKNNVYIEAARALGCSNIRIMTRHILPNIMPLYVVVVSLFLGSAIIVESSLSFLGVGVSPGTPSWGRMVTEGTSSLFLAGAYLAIYPSLAIAITVFAFNIVGDTFRDIWDPRLRGAQ